MTLGEKISFGSSWTRDDDIAFERALAIYANETEIRWEKIATVVPHKTLEQLIEHYNILTRDVMLIETGCVPLLDYDDFSEEPDHNASGKEISMLESGNNRKSEFKQKNKAKLKQKRRKAIPWTSHEHRQFLLGLEKFGKGDWRSISRNFVLTRTPTQVASHAQKYFARLNSKNKTSNRASIHDTTVADNKNISTKQRAITENTRSINFAGTSNNQAIQATSQPLLDLPIHGTPNIWNTQATQAISQPTPNHPHNLFNTQAISQPSLNHPTYGAPTIRNTQAPLQLSASIPGHGTSTINQAMVGPMLSPFGTNMNHMGQPHMTSIVQPYPVPYNPAPSVPINMDSVSFDINLLN